MAFSDPTFEARRSQVISGSSEPAPSSPGISTGRFSDPIFEARRETIINTPAQPSVSAPSPSVKPVSTPASTTKSAPNLLQQTGDFVSGAVKGITKTIEQNAPTIIKGLQFAINPIGSAVDFVKPQIQVPKIQPPQITADTVKKSFIEAAKSNPLYQVGKFAAQQYKFDADFIAGIFGEGSADQKRAGGQNFAPEPTASFTPKSQAQQFGAYAYSFLKDLTAYQNAGINDAFGKVLESAGTAVKGSTFLAPKVAWVQQSLESLADKTLTTFMEKINPIKLTMQDLRDVNGVGGAVASPDQLARYKRAVEYADKVGVSISDVVKASSGEKPSTTLYDFLGKTIETLKKSIKSMLSPEDVKLLESGKPLPAPAIVEPGEYTGTDLINKVFKSNLENTSEGKAIIKVASDAQTQGKTIIVGAPGESLVQPKYPSGSPIEVTKEPINVYRGALDQTLDINQPNGITGGVSFSTDKSVAQRFADQVGGTVITNKIPAGVKVVDHSFLETLPKDQVQNYIKTNGIDVVKFDVPKGVQGEAEYRVVSEKGLSTPSSVKPTAVTPSASPIEGGGEGTLVNPKVMSTDELLKIIDERVGGYRSPEQIARLRADIEKNGITYPVELIEKADGTFQIYDGNHRVLIAKDLGIKEIPVKVIESQKIPAKTEIMKVYSTDQKKIDLAVQKMTERGDTIISIKKTVDSRGDSLTNIKFKPAISAITPPPSPTPVSISVQPQKVKKVPVGEQTFTLEEAKKPKISAKEKEIPQSEGAYAFKPKNLTEPESKVAQTETEKIIKRSDIAKALSEKLNVPIRRGKFRAPGALGIYKAQPKVVRVKGGGLQTVFHEVAHYLDDTIGFSKEIPEEERNLLLEEYAKPPKDPVRQRKEAFAEYMRFRMTGQTEKIKNWAPQFDEIFSKKIQTLPEIKDVLDTATQDYARWQAQPSTAKILSHISIGSAGDSPFKDRAIQFSHDLYTAALDDLHPLSEFEKLAEKKLGRKLAAIEDPYILARNLRGWVGKADLFLNRGTFGKEFWKIGENKKIKMNFNGKGYSDIMKPVEEAKALDDFRVYIVSQRVVYDLSPRGIKTGVSVEDAKNAIAELEKKHPEFPAIAEERRAYKDKLLEYAKDNGILGEKGLAQIRELNKYHVPFYRVMEQTTTKFLGKTKIAGNISSPIKRIKGSEREIIDPLESDVKDTYAIINAAERNNIGIAMANIAKQNSDLGRLFEEVARPMKPVTVNAKEVLEKALKETGLLEVPEFPPELADLVVTLFRPTYATGANMLNVNFGDSQKVFEVDSDLFKAIQGLDVEDVGLIMKILSAPAKILRAGATLTPDFSVRNPLRDQFTALAYSKYGFIPGVDLVRGMFELLKAGDVYELWKAGGGEHAMFVSLDRNALQESLQEVVGSKKAELLTFIKNPLKILQILSEYGEAGTRLGEMRNALARGVDPVQAAYDSRNVTLDFSRIGAKTKAINAIIAFFNANIQGTDTMIRNFKNRPFQTLWKVLVGITLPSVLLYFANRKDPRWNEIPQWQKDLFWIILTPKHIVRIPKPFELGVLFGSVPERILQIIDTKDPYAIGELENTIANGFTPGFLPTALIPIIENITNYSFFQQRPIVNQSKTALPPSQQANTFTSETAKLIGEALNYSPAKIDNLVYGYTGGLGKYATSALDNILKGTGIRREVPAPAPKLEDFPVIKAYMVREPIGTSSESVNRVYNLYASANQELTYVKQLIKEGKSDQAKSYAQKHPEVINAVVLGGAINSFSDMNKAIDAVRSSETMSPQDKTKKIDLIQRLETSIAQKVLVKVKK